ncbi:MAG: tRNA-dihydrouridine synthase [Patescibacteria group bacterium]
MKNFWQTIKRPFFVQAPMDDVTDTVFRQIIAACAPPDVYFSEFTCVDALYSAGKSKALQKLKFTEIERPIVAQVWGTEPELFFKSAKLIAELGYDGIDINLGCPDKAVLKKGAGGALIKDPEKVSEIVAAVRKGAPSLGLSIKTRLGFKQVETEEWLGFLLGLPIDALTVHLRTVAELSKVPAHWEEMGKIVALRKQMKSKILLIGNGDVKTRVEGLEKCRQYGIDGIMIGRGILNNYWVFGKSPYVPEINEKLELLEKHLKLSEQTWGKDRNFNNLKKFYKYYLSGHPAGKALRIKLMAVTTIEETLAILKREK